MKFSKEFLRDHDGKTIYNRVTGTSRWSIDYERVFEHEGKYYLTTYSVGATEQQDERAYEYDPDEIECVEVFPQERTVTVYEPVVA